MNLREKRIAIVKENIASCLQAKSPALFYTYGNIPQRCIEGARRSYGNLYGVNHDDIIGLIDTTVFNGGERGMIFTVDGVYYREMLNTATYASYDEVDGFRVPDDVYFDGNGVSRMLLLLHQADENLGTSLLNIAGDLLNYFADMVEQEVAEKTSGLDDEKETADAIEFYTSVKDTIKDFRNMVEPYEVIQLYSDEDSFEDNIEQAFKVLVLAAIVVNEKSILEDSDYTADQGKVLSEFADVWQENVECIDQVFNKQSAGENALYLNKACRKYYHRVTSAFEELQEDFDEMGERIGEATKEFREYLLLCIKRLNQLIDDLYE